MPDNNSNGFTNHDYTSVNFAMLIQDQKGDLAQILSYFDNYPTEITADSHALITNVKTDLQAMLENNPTDEEYQAVISQSVFKISNEIQNSIRCISSRQPFAVKTMTKTLQSVFSGELGITDPRILSPIAHRTDSQEILEVYWEYREYIDSHLFSIEFINWVGFALVTHLQSKTRQIEENATHNEW